MLVKAFRVNVICCGLRTLPEGAETHTQWKSKSVMDQCSSGGITGTDSRDAYASKNKLPILSAR